MAVGGGLTSWLALVPAINRGIGIETERLVLAGRHDARKPASCLAQTDRSFSSAGILMAEHAAAPRLRDIVDAIDRIRSEMEGVTLDAFAADRRKR